MIEDPRCQNCVHWIALSEGHLEDGPSRDVASIGGCIGKPCEHLKHARIDGSVGEILIVTPFDWFCAGWTCMPKTEDCTR